MKPLPIDALLPDLVRTLAEHRNVVLRAPTGAGKTTRVPPALLDAGLADAGRIVVLEPRRLPARAAARRMADERQLALGGTFGYHVRFDRRASDQTRVLVVTPGILLRMLHDDALLESVAALVFDEFHERGVESDLALGLARLLQQTVRPELKLLVMSATLAVERIAAYLDHAPVLTSEGRLHPVAVHYAPRGLQQPVAEAAAEAVAEILPRSDGDLLVFLPGMQEIRQTAQALEALAQREALAVFLLHGDLAPEEQDRALAPCPRRKVILSTNVAETSVTIDGVTAVIDTGLARQLQFDPNLGMDRLQTVPIARDAVDQRSGRAGRTRPGVALRLWSEASQRQRPEATEPEIRRVDLASVVLHLAALGESKLETFPWFEAPRPEAIDQARELLRRLGALAGEAITPSGQQLARLPVPPRLGRLLLEGQRLGHAREAALAAALLAERDPFLRGAPRAQGADSSSDVLERVEALARFERDGRTESRVGVLHPGGARGVLRARDQLLRLLPEPPQPPAEVDLEEALLRAVLAAFPDRVVRRREPGSPRGRMLGGRGVRLAPGSAVTQAELFVAVDVDAGGSESFVRMASAIQRDWLRDRLQAVTEVAFDPATERVVARRLVKVEDLVLEETAGAAASEEDVMQALVRAAATDLAKVLPSAESAAGSLLLRARWLRAVCPELNLPPLDDADLLDLLPWLCAGRRSFAELRQADWHGLLLGKFTPAQQQTLDREAPVRIQVPSGSSIALHYEPGRPPVLAVRIQELFGLRDTPKLAGGRVRVLLHLLAPNARPQQVTDDLASFWANTYPQVRKDLRARYPKHSWPEDPLVAEPMRGAKRRS